MLLRKTVHASAYPITLTEAKEHLRVDHADDDALIAPYIGAACAAVGEMAGRVLATETWELAVASVVGDLVLPLAPVQAVTAIKYYDDAGADVSATVSDYYLFSDDDRAFLRPKPGKAWPVTRHREDALRVTFTAGYTSLPANLRGAALLMIGHFYENRDATGDAKSEIPLGVEALVAMSRRGWITS